MADRFKYSEVRQKIIDSIRTDLIGPQDENEVLEENPRYAYLVGMLDVQSDDENYSSVGQSPALTFSCHLQSVSVSIFKIQLKASI